MQFASHFPNAADNRNNNHDLLPKHHLAVGIQPDENKKQDGKSNERGTAITYKWKWNAYHGSKAHSHGYIDDYIRYEVTGAHSPWHQVFWIEEEGEVLFFGGDDAPQLQQMKHRFAAKYDYDGKKAMELRQEWWQKGNKEGWTFLFYHDIKTPVYK